MNSIESLQVLYYNLKSHMSRDNPMFDLEYEQIKKDLKFLEILKNKFYIKFETYDCGSFLRVVGNEDYGEYCGICVEAYSDNLQNDEETAFLEEYFKENKDE